MLKSGRQVEDVSCDPIIPSECISIYRGYVAKDILNNKSIKINMNGEDDDLYGIEDMDEGVDEVDMNIPEFNNKVTIIVPRRGESF
jgi:hypothetical protein